jgi:chemotaxis signal transduction protein
MSGYLLVRVGTVRYGLPLHAVVEVVDSTQVFPVPGSHPAVRGVTPVRGRLVTRVRLGALIGGAAVPAGPGGTLAVVDGGGGSIALEVDDAEGIVREDPVPAPPGWDVPLTQGVTRYDGELIPILDLAGVVERLTATEAGV